jgi:SET domain-containing protein
MMISTFLYIGNSGRKGRGVFTREGILPNTVIEISPVVVMTGTDRTLLDQTRLHDYIFEWGKSQQECCMALGYIALYNHSYKSNCEYEMEYDQEVISIKTMRYIQAGEELFINYNGNWNDQRPVWFEAK